jgi:uncharacterized membrane protein
MDNQNQGQNSNQPPLNVPGNNMVMGILSYLGVLVIIPYIVAKNNSVVKFHVKQGLVLLGIEVIVWILGYVAGPLALLLLIVNLGVLVLSIIGIINVVQGNQKELPLVGKFAKNINI